MGKKNKEIDPRIQALNDDIQIRKDKSAVAVTLIPGEDKVTKKRNLLKIIEELFATDLRTNNAIQNLIEFHEVNKTLFKEMMSEEDCNKLGFLLRPYYAIAAIKSPFSEDADVTNLDNRVAVILNAPEQNQSYFEQLANATITFYELTDIFNKYGILATDLSMAPIQLGMKYTLVSKGMKETIDGTIADPDNIATDSLKRDIEAIFNTFKSLSENANRQKAVHSRLAAAVAATAATDSTTEAKALGLRSSGEYKPVSKDDEALADGLNTTSGKLSLSSSSLPMSNSASSLPSSESISSSTPTLSAASNNKLASSSNKTEHFTALANDLISKIDNYELASTPNNKSAGDILGDEGLTKLHKGTKESNTARTAFVRELMQILQDTNTDNSNKPASANEATITLEELFKSKPGLLDLYKKAVEEERNSKAFREAVFLRATTYQEGPTWTKRMILWVAGPSASGKSFAKNAVLAEASKTMTNDPAKIGNYITSIDGGIERETSQMRQLVLQAALQKGYSGIDGLDNNTKLKTKGIIEKAALANKNLSLVIPVTFTRGHSKLNESMGLEDTVNIFSEVVADNINHPDVKTAYESFEQTVARNGNIRAWSNTYGSPTNLADRSVKMNELNIGSESKAYNGKHFDTGMYHSMIAANEFIQKSEPGKYIRIVNDLIFITISADHRWRPCTKDENPSDIVRLTQRQYNALGDYQISKENLLEKLKTTLNTPELSGSQAQVVTKTSEIQNRKIPNRFYATSQGITTATSTVKAAKIAARKMSKRALANKPQPLKQSSTGSEAKESSNNIKSTSAAADLNPRQKAEQDKKQAESLALANAEAEAFFTQTPSDEPPKTSPADRQLVSAPTSPQVSNNSIRKSVKDSLNNILRNMEQSVLATYSQRLESITNNNTFISNKNYISSLIQHKEMMEAVIEKFRAAISDPNLTQNAMIDILHSSRSLLEQQNKNILPQLLAVESHHIVEATKMTSSNAPGADLLHQLSESINQAHNQLLELDTALDNATAPSIPVTPASPELVRQPTTPVDTDATAQARSRSNANAEPQTASVNHARAIDDSSLTILLPQLPLVSSVDILKFTSTGSNEPYKSDIKRLAVLRKQFDLPTTDKNRILTDINSTRLELYRKLVDQLSQHPDLENNLYSDNADTSSVIKKYIETSQNILNSGINQEEKLAQIDAITHLNKGILEQFAFPLDLALVSLPKSASHIEADNNHTLISQATILFSDTETLNRLKGEELRQKLLKGTQPSASRQRNTQRKSPTEKTNTEKAKRLDRNARGWIRSQSPATSSDISKAPSAANPLTSSTKPVKKATDNAKPIASAKALPPKFVPDAKTRNRAVLEGMKYALKDAKTQKLNTLSDSPSKAALIEALEVLEMNVDNALEDKNYDDISKIRKQLENLKISIANPNQQSPDNQHNNPNDSALSSASSAPSIQTSPVSSSAAEPAAEVADPAASAAAAGAEAEPAAAADPVVASSVADPSAPVPAERATNIENLKAGIENIFKDAEAQKEIAGKLPKDNFSVERKIILVEIIEKLFSGIKRLEDRYDAINPDEASLTQLTQNLLQELFKFKIAFAEVLQNEISAAQTVMVESAGINANSLDPNEKSVLTRVLNSHSSGLLDAKQSLTGVSHTTKKPKADIFLTEMQKFNANKDNIVTDLKRALAQQQVAALTSASTPAATTTTSATTPSFMVKAFKAFTGLIAGLQKEERVSNSNSAPQATTSSDVSAAAPAAAAADPVVAESAAAASAAEPAAAAEPVAAVPAAAAEPVVAAAPAAAATATAAAADPVAAEPAAAEAEPAAVPASAAAEAEVAEPAAAAADPVVAEPAATAPAVEAAAAAAEPVAAESEAAAPARAPGFNNPHGRRSSIDRQASPVASTASTALSSHSINTNDYLADGVTLQPSDDPLPPAPAASTGSPAPERGHGISKDDNEKSPKPREALPGVTLRPAETDEKANPTPLSDEDNQIINLVSNDLSRYLRTAQYYAAKTELAAKSAHGQDDQAKFQALCQKMKRQIEIYQHAIDNGLIEISGSNQVKLNEIFNQLERAQKMEHKSDNKIAHFSDESFISQVKNINEAGIMELLNKQSVPSTSLGGLASGKVKEDIKLIQTTAKIAEQNQVRVNTLSIQTKNFLTRKNSQTNVVAIQSSNAGVHKSDFYYHPDQVKRFSKAEYTKWAITVVEDFRAGPDSANPNKISAENPIIIRGKMPPELANQIAIYCELKGYPYVNRVTKFEPKNLDVQSMDHFLNANAEKIFGKAEALGLSEKGKTSQARMLTEDQINKAPPYTKKR